MNMTELPFIVFAACNALRIAAYFPQMFKLSCEPGAAASFSYATWVLFAAANLSTAVYAGATLGDAMLATANGFSALCCVVLIVLALWRSRRPVAWGRSALR